MRRDNDIVRDGLELWELPKPVWMHTGVTLAPELVEGYILFFPGSLATSIPTPPQIGTGLR